MSGEDLTSDGAGWGDVPNLSLRQLAYFLTAANQLSVLRAAETLNVSPSSVSTAISQLERILDVKLFTRRHARGILLTPAGRDLAVHARSILLHVREIEAMGERGGRARAPVRLNVGCLNTLAPYLVPHLIQAAGRDLSRTVIRWSENSHEELLEALHSGALDLIIVYDYDMPSTVQTQPLRTMPVQLVLPATHPLARREKLPLSAMAKEPFLLLDVPKTRDYFLSIFAAAGIEPHITYRTASFEMLRSMVANGLGYTLLNFVPPYLAAGQGRLVSRPLEGVFQSQELVLARLYRARPPGRFDQLVATARTCVGALTIISAPEEVVG